MNIRLFLKLQLPKFFNGVRFLYVSSAVLYPVQQGVLSVNTEGDQSSVVSRYRYLSNVICIPKVLKGRSVR